MVQTAKSSYINGVNSVHTGFVQARGAAGAQLQPITASTSTGHVVLEEAAAERGLVVGLPRLGRTRGHSATVLISLPASEPAALPVAHAAAAGYVSSYSPGF